MSQVPGLARLTSRFFGQPIYRALALSFLLMVLVPVGFLAANIYRVAWDDAWREIYEKHRLLAQNLAAPISVYVDDHRHMLGQLAYQLATVEEHPGAERSAHDQLQAAFRYLEGFHSLLLVDTDGRTRAVAHRTAAAPADPMLFAAERCFVTTRDTGQSALSNVKPSPITGKPTLILSQPVHGAGGGVRAVLLGELRMDLIESLRKTIRFGDKGHSAIVDKTGRVIAHPNAAWMAEMRDLSDWPIVQAMMAGESGVTEFYSPFIKAHMVAGYAPVPEIGWGIMVPQPKAEVEAQVNTLLYSHLQWGVGGLILAIALVLPLVRWIAGPIDRLAEASSRLVERDFEGELPQTHPHAPREIRQLGVALDSLVSGLQQSRAEVTKLNRSLQSRVDDATRQLRDANAQLEVMARSDHLTRLPNRRHFENTLGSQLKRRTTDQQDLCVMLIDVDNFKQINDKFGHAAGDMVLVSVADILSHAMRPGDVVARYGGDEFVAQMRCSHAVGLSRAQQVLRTIAGRRFSWRDETVSTTVSIGLFHCAASVDVEVESLLGMADAAMYEAKKLGRNTVVDITGTSCERTADGALGL